MLISYDKKIEVDPAVCGGSPVIAGTRIPVSIILDELSEGDSWDEILKGHPELAREDISAAVRYASNLVYNTDILELKAV